MIERLYLARHGFRLSWQTQVYENVTGTPRDPPLASYGHDQSKELAKFLHDLPPSERPDLIISSPLYRCLQTAVPASEMLDKPILVEHGLSEWYLPVRMGLHPRSKSASALKEYIPEIDPSYESQLLVTQLGETMEQIHDRAEEVLRLIIARFDNQSNIKNVLLFTHAATNIALGRALVGDRDLDIRSGTCSLGVYSRVEKEGRNGLGVWQIIDNGRSDFLSKGEERHWDFSYVEAYEEDGILEDGQDGVLVSDNYKPMFGKSRPPADKPASNTKL